MDRRNFRIRAASTAVNTLTVPCNRSSMDALNNGHKDYLSESDFRRASGAKLVVDGSPSARYSAFGRIESGKRAVVLLNQDPHKAIIAKFKLDGTSRSLIAVTPEYTAPKPLSDTIMILPCSEVRLIDGWQDW